MDPVTVGAIASVASAGAQWLSSEQARKANKAERKRMEEMLAKIQSPQFDPTDLTPEEYKVAAKYVPEMAAFVEEAAPQVVKQTEDMAMGRRAQKEALQKLSDIGSSRGVDPQMAALANQANRRAQTEAQVRQQSILQDAARRGQAGSAANIAQQLMAGGNSMDQLANTQNQLAADAYRQRLQALAESGQMGRQLQQDEIGLQKTNADIINDFNRRNTAARQGYLNSAADTQNEAQRYNVGQIQDIANRNVGLKNEYAKYNQNRGDDIAQRNYDNQMKKFGASSGLSQQQQQANVQGAADRNQAIQGASNIFGGMMQSWQADSAAKDAQDREDRRSEYMRTGKWPTT